MFSAFGLPIHADNDILPDFWNDFWRQGLVNTFAVVMLFVALYNRMGEQSVSAGEE